MGNQHVRRVCIAPPPGDNRTRKLLIIVELGYQAAVSQAQSLNSRIQILRGERNYFGPRAVY
jgi:hypothetical protein